MVLIDSPASSVVSVDWFALSCVLAHPYDGSPLAVPHGWSVVECGKTAVWDKRWFLMDYLGNKVATVLAVPRSPIIDARRCVVEIANQWLYHPSFLEVVDLALQCYPMSIDGVNRVDLCCDFEMSPSQWEVVSCLVDSSVYLKGLRRGNIWWFADNGKRIPHQLAWGGRDSTFHWKLYYKYKELHEGGTTDASKPYIEDMWRSLGMDVRAVWRLEVSIMNSNSLEGLDSGAKIPFLDWYVKRLELFQRIYADKFVLRMNEGHKDKRNDPIVKFLDLGGSKLLKYRNSDATRTSDVERRVVVKMWKEFIDGEVRANTFLWKSIGDFLRNMCQFERNVSAIMRRFNIDRSEVMSTLDEPLYVAYGSDSDELDERMLKAMQKAAFEVTAALDAQ